jgi:mannose-6-phosphate isomerase-like protein (cupin superfamily)
MARAVTSSRYSVDVERVEKPWGHELIWARAERYSGKILAVRAGESLSLQYHRVKDESWFVLDGRASIEVGEGERQLQEIVVEAGDAVRFRPGIVHRVTALEDTRILEASTPELDDIVRLDDRYGRA